MAAFLRQDCQSLERPCFLRPEEGENEWVKLSRKIFEGLLCGRSSSGRMIRGVKGGSHGERDDVTERFVVTAALHDCFEG